MAEGDVSSVSVAAVTAAVGAVVLLFVLLCGMFRKLDNKEDAPEKEENTTETRKPMKQQQQAGHKKKETARRKETRAAFSHPWLSCSLKNHSSPVLDFDFSANGKYLASCAEDRTLVIWNVKELEKKEHKLVRGNVELDHATQVKFSPDTKAVLVNLCNENTLRVMKLGKKSDGALTVVSGGFDFPKKHDAEIKFIGMASSGRFVMTCDKSTFIRIWDLKGDVLAVIDTHQMNNSYAAVSPCGKFFGSAGFTPDVKVWEVCFDKVGTFKEVTRAFELKGHTAGIHSFAFSTDSHRMATVSKDGTWKLWNTYVEYQKQQDPYLLQTGQHADHGLQSFIALSPDCKTVAIATAATLKLYNADTRECQKEIADIHTGSITRVLFDPTSRYVLTTGDKHIHAFFNIAGYEANITELEGKKSKATTQTMRERIQSQIEEYRQLVVAVENSS